MRLWPQPRTSAEQDSPCVKVCRLDLEVRLCLGCFRSPGEITDWSTLSWGQRQKILKDLPQRKAGFAHRQATMP